MSAAAMVRGWCPSLFRPMESGDGWLARIRPQAGALPADLCRAVAEAAARYGNGIVEVTNRANIQVRGLQPATIAPFTDAMEAAGGAAGEGSRLLVSPLLGADPRLAPDLPALARDIDRALTDAPLSAKFGVVLDGGGALPLGGIALDVTIRFRDGLWRVNGVPCAPADIPARVVALAAEAPRRSERAGPPPAPGAYAGFVLIAPAFGQMRAEAFAGLAALAAQHGDGWLRATPWKSLCIAGVAASAALLEAAAQLGFITDPADGRLSIVTCAGAPACLRAEMETQSAAAFLAGHRHAGDSLLHLAGCPKGCAHPGAAAVTLTGRAGHFDLIRAGKAGDSPAIGDLALAQIPALLHSLRHE